MFIFEDISKSVISFSSILIAISNIYFVFVARKYLVKIASDIGDMRRSLRILKIHVLRQVKNERRKTAKEI